MLLRGMKGKEMVGYHSGNKRRKQRKQLAKQLIPSSSSVSDSDLQNLDELIRNDIPYLKINKESCPVCKKFEGNTAGWIGCDM